MRLPGRCLFCTLQPAVLARESRDHIAGDTLIVLSAALESLPLSCAARPVAVLQMLDDLGGPLTGIVMPVTAGFAETTHPLPNFPGREFWRQLPQCFPCRAYTTRPVLHTNQQQAIHFWQPYGFARVFLTGPMPFHCRPPLQTHLPHLLWLPL